MAEHSSIEWIDANGNQYEVHEDQPRLQAVRGSIRELFPEYLATIMNGA